MQDSDPAADLIGLTLDGHDNVYVAGKADSPDLPTTPDVVQTASGGGRDGFVGRLRADGTALDWLTYYGGAKADALTGVRLDGMGNVYVVGETTSPDFPTRGPALTPCATNGDRDLVVVGFSPQAGEVRYATCIGGSGDDYADQDAPVRPFYADLAVSDAGTAYIAAFTLSTDFPVTAAAWQRTLHGDADAVVARLTPAGLVSWASYHGSHGVDEAFGVAVTRGAHVLVAGHSSTGGMPGAPPPDTHPGIDQARMVADPVTGPAWRVFVSRLRPSAAEHAGSPAPSPTASPDPTPTTSPPAPGSARPTPGNAAATAAETPTPTETSPSGAPPESATTRPESGPATPTPSPGAAEPCHKGNLRAVAGRLVAGQRARVRYTGTPGAYVRVEGYSRRTGEPPQYRRLRAEVQVPASGTVDYSFAPTTNTRLRAVDGCGPTDSLVLLVAPRLRLTASPSGQRRYTVTGTLAPDAASDGRTVTVLYRSGNGEVRKTVVRTVRGRWTARLRFTTPRRVVLLVRSSGDVVQAAGRSADVTITVR